MSPSNTDRPVTEFGCLDEKKSQKSQTPLGGRGKILPIDNGPSIYVTDANFKFLRTLTDY